MRCWGRCVSRSPCSDQWTIDSVDALEHFVPDCAASKVPGIEPVEDCGNVGTKSQPLVTVGDRLKVEHRKLADVDSSTDRGTHRKDVIDATLEVAIELLIGKDYTKPITRLDRIDDLKHLLVSHHLPPFSEITRNPYIFTETFLSDTLIIRPYFEFVKFLDVKKPPSWRFLIYGSQYKSTS